ncbi:MAG TPA: amidohydrolase family protein [Bacteroidales bacterium]|jgi:cytosine/adenosine deaminase-related metal-dependent hydrolase|nr:amidohydrolase family protein [Bacteroidales bacterium]OQB61340.1 MAG: Adenosine deaminase [Bacteroidetes bacterium ADurb.Bin145]HQG62600.1 amidohydrolase family protein [Bacteroidales bacterium]
MRSFSAHYILTNSGPLLKRSVIRTDDDGTIISIEDTKGCLKEDPMVEFYNGIIIPGFVNCHCHLELSHLKGKIPAGTGLADFITKIRTLRETDEETIISSAASADKDLFNEGINLCADICNTPATFGIKKSSRIKYLNLLEVFGIDPLKADHRMQEIIRLSVDAANSGLEWSIIPHAVYSISLPLFRLIKKITRKNRVTSIHFLETDSEVSFLEGLSGRISDSYLTTGHMPRVLKTVKDHVTAILKEITPSGNLILVHNTFADNSTVRALKKRKNLFWCLCPGSNIYIENKLPPINLLRYENCDIVIGSDSLASNTTLSILSELKILQDNFPQLGLEELVRWATINGARALGEDQHFGKIERGMKPGLLLLQDIDLVNLKLLPTSTVTRLL